VDYSTELTAIPTISAGDILSGRIRPELLAGKDVLIGTDSDVIGDRYFVPGYGRAGGVFVHAIGAETLKRGQPLDLGWFIPFLFALAIAALAATRKRLATRYATLGTATLGLLIMPIFLESRLFFFDITPALF